MKPFLSYPSVWIRCNRAGKGLNYNQVRKITTNPPINQSLGINRAVDTNDTKKIYASKKTTELMRTLFLLKLISMPFSSEKAPKLLNKLIDWKLDGFVYWLLRKTVFPHFVAGESLDETLKRLSTNPFRPILCYSVESPVHVDANHFDKVADLTSQINIECGKVGSPFNALKIGGLTNHQVMRALNDLVSSIEFDSVVNASNEDVVRIVKATADNLNRPLSNEIVTQLSQLLSRLDSIFSSAKEAKVRVLIDAEQTYYQKTIDFIAILACSRYNKDSPVLYNTYQMYRVGALDKLKNHHAIAQKYGYYFAAKCVRGAYMVEERKLAKEFNLPDPIQPTIDDTHKSYNSGIAYLLEQINENKRVALVVASHNEDTANNAVTIMKETSMSLNNPNIHFAQLMGMCDHLSFALKETGVNACKLFPFGPVKEVFPYLVRRMQENKGFVGSTTRERQLLTQEIKRRWTEK